MQQHHEAERGGDHARQSDQSPLRLVPNRLSVANIPLQQR
jgi:hypothetical protein